jgi:hypothetical protein
MVVLLVGVLCDSRPRPLIVGLAAALLLMVRPYWVLYAVPTLASTARRRLRDGSQPGRVVAILALTLPLVGAAAQLSMVNRWMTGDFRRFAYLFGDADFQSLDLLHPELAAVLWHPLHGLLVYHPAVGLGICAMIALVFRAPTTGERITWAAFIAVVGVNIYVQACWYTWWQATGITLGMRGAVPAAVPAIAALARWTQLASRRLSGHVVIVLTTICGIWSWLMLPPGPTDYVTYRALTDGLLAELDRMLDPRFIFLAVPGLFLGAGLIPVVATGSDGKRTSVVAATAAATLVSLWAVYAWTQLALGPEFFGWLDAKRDPFLTGSSALRQAAIVVSISAAMGVGAGALAKFAIDWRRLSERVTALVAAAALVIFAVAGYRIETGPTRIPTRPPRYPGKPFFVPELQANWDDYQTIPGFQEPKQRLHDFLVRQGIPLDYRSPPPGPGSEMPPIERINPEN